MSKINKQLEVALTEWAKQILRSNPASRLARADGGCKKNIAGSKRAGPRLNIKIDFPRYGDSHVIFNMRIPILVRPHLYIESDHTVSYRFSAVKLPWIFPGDLLNFNGAPGNV